VLISAKKAGSASNPIHALAHASKKRLDITDGVIVKYNSTTASIGRLKNSSGE
jgi:hypothetical protein